jgi:hypothetical protein
LLKFFGSPESFDGLMIIEPGRPEVHPFFGVPVDVGIFTLYGYFKKIIIFGTATLAQVQVWIGGSWWTDHIRHVKMGATHGATELTRRTLHYPLQGLGPLSVQFFVPFSF